MAIVTAALLTLAAWPADAQQPGRQGAPPQPTVRGGYTEAATLQVRIMEFTADRPSIKPG